MNNNPKPDTLAVISRKVQLRREMIRLREALPPSACSKAAGELRGQILNLLAELDLTGGGRPLNIGVYAAIRNELDLAPVWPDLQKWPARLFFPAVQGQGTAARLVFGPVPDAVQPAHFLVPGRFGIAEPPPEFWLPEPPDLDIILVPGLAFDRQGNRLGWGKAFYDRFLQTLPGNPILVGICYAFQVLPDTLPVEPTDHPVDWLVTPDAYWQIKS